MFYKKNYQSPLGKLEILCDDTSVKGIWFENQKYYGSHFELNSIQTSENEVIKQVEKWLDAYFNGEQPRLEQLNLQPDVTEYRKKVLKILVEIPYGKTMTYKEIAEKLNNKYPSNKTSARAVGGAVGHNPISILIPCHRVVGTNASLTGFAGGLNRKVELLALEGFDKKILETGFIKK
ncbi:methylated-DNA--[protein]-cysteine S-methyltransferase [Vagococcus sp.]|uniref:methylated-DNA--[protein]-cysteine S-methyltransferase n=1 Tax=Vagococcus sp. TaxID=1933889 RepID=UPI002FC87170